MLSLVSPHHHSRKWHHQEDNDVDQILRPGDGHHILSESVQGKFKLLEQRLLVAVPTFELVFSSLAFAYGILSGTPCMSRQISQQHMQMQEGYSCKLLRYIV